MKHNWRDKKYLSEIVSRNTNYIDCIRDIGAPEVGANYDRLKRWITTHNIDTSHFEPGWTAAHRVNRQNARTIEDALVENSTATRVTVRSIIFKNDLLEYVCHECGCPPIWNGKPITLQLDHKNGVNNDHRLENLRFLCPNCHSQTPTWGFKRGKSN